MKTLNLILAGIVLMSTLATQSCKKDDKKTEEENTNTTSIIPTNFNVDVPGSISSSVAATKSKGGTINGRDIYGHIRTFIYVGDQAGKIVGDIITGITKHNINKAMVTTFIGDDDNRSKELTVIEKATFEGITWEFGLTIIDKESAAAADGGKGIQVFWNKSPIKGIAIMKPYNINRTGTTTNLDAMYRVDYSEGGENGYDKQMVVAISGLTLTSDKYSINTMKMFAGQKGSIVDVYGNSNHPKAYFVDSTNVGFNYAFVASADMSSDLGVAEVGLPASSLDASTRTAILEDASVKNVFTNQIKIAYPLATQDQINAVLVNTEAPGYFNKSGFFQAGGTVPSTHTTVAPRIASLIPYTPKLISQLDVIFAK